MHKHLKHPVTGEQPNSDAVYPLVFQVIKPHDGVNEKDSATEQLQQNQPTPLIFDEVEQSTCKSHVLRHNEKFND